MAVLGMIVFKDFVALYMAQRTRQWVLRLAGLKQMAPLFCAFDHPTYNKLVPDHPADLQSFPKYVITSMERGICSCLHPKGISFLDNAHEMGINKGTKQLVVRLTEDNMHRISTMMHYKANVHAMIKALLNISPYQSHHLPDKVSPKHCFTLVKVNNNISRMMMESIQQSKMLTAVSFNRGLVNFISNIKATAEQERDLLNYNSVGLKEFKIMLSIRENTRK